MTPLIVMKPICSVRQCPRKVFMQPDSNLCTAEQTMHAELRGLHHQPVTSAVSKGAVMLHSYATVWKRVNVHLHTCCQVLIHLHRSTFRNKFGLVIGALTIRTTPALDCSARMVPSACGVAVAVTATIGRSPALHRKVSRIWEYSGL